MTASLQHTPLALITPLTPAPRAVPVVEGHCSGQLLHRWAENLTRRFGADAPAVFIQALGPRAAAGLPRAPRTADRIPLSTLLAVTETLLEQLHDGDREAMYRATLEDTRRALPRGAGLLLRGLGLRRVLQKAPGLHRRLYDVGRVSVEVGRGEATLRFDGAALFEHPTWQLLQGFAVRMLFELMQGPQPQLMGQRVGAGRYALHVHWR